MMILQQYFERVQRPVCHVLRTDPAETGASFVISVLYSLGFQFAINVARVYHEMAVCRVAPMRDQIYFPTIVHVFMIYSGVSGMGYVCNLRTNKMHILLDTNSGGN